MPSRIALANRQNLYTVCAHVVFPSEVVAACGRSSQCGSRPDSANGYPFANVRARKSSSSNMSPEISEASLPSISVSNSSSVSGSVSIVRVSSRFASGNPNSSARPTPRLGPVRDDTSSQSASSLRVPSGRGLSIGIAGVPLPDPLSRRLHGAMQQ